MRNTRTSFYAQIAYAAPVVSAYCLVTPVAVLQGIYSKYHGLSLTAIATIIVFARLFDAVSDPLIGLFSDRFYRRQGSYKPIILVGTLLLMISSYCLYVPLIEVSFTYLLLCFLVFYFSWTLFEIPHISWANALAPDATAKSMIFSLRGGGGYLGMLMFYAIPLLPIFATQDITPETLKISVLLANSLLLIFLCLCLRYTPDAHPLLSRQPSADRAQTQATLSLKKQCAELVNVIIVNKPLLLFVSAYLFIGVGGGMWYGLIFIYVDGYLQMGEQFARMFLLAFFIGVASAPLWYKLMTWLGKKCAVMLSLLLLLASVFWTAFLTPGNTSFTELVLLKGVQTLGYTGLGIIAPALLGEIIDYGQWKTQQDSAGLCFSLYTFMGKSCSALGGGLSLALAAWYGFDMSADAHSAASLFGLKLGISWLPALLISLAFIFFALGPIDTRRHRTIRKALQRRADRRIQQSQSNNTHGMPVNEQAPTALAAQH